MQILYTKYLATFIVQNVHQIKLLLIFDLVLPKNPKIDVFCLLF